MTSNADRLIKELLDLTDDRLEAQNLIIDLINDTIDETKTVIVSAL